TIIKKSIFSKSMDAMMVYLVFSKINAGTYFLHFQPDGMSPTKNSGLGTTKFKCLNLEPLMESWETMKQITGILSISHCHTMLMQMDGNGQENTIIYILLP